MKFASGSISPANPSSIWIAQTRTTRRESKIFPGNKNQKTRIEDLFSSRTQETELKILTGNNRRVPHISLVFRDVGYHGP